MPASITSLPAVEVALDRAEQPAAIAAVTVAVDP